MTGEWTGDPVSTPHGAPAGAGEASEAAPEPGRALTRDGGGRFAAGNPGGGRPKGARTKLTDEFYKTISDDFDEHGRETLAKLRIENPEAYYRIIGSYVPRQKIQEYFGSMTNDEAYARIEQAERHARIKKIIDDLEGSE